MSLFRVSVSQYSPYWRRSGRDPGVTPLYGYIGMCHPKGYGFSAVLVMNRVLILAILFMNKVWFLNSGLEFSVFLRRSYFFRNYQ